MRATCWPDMGLHESPDVYLLPFCDYICLAAGGGWDGFFVFIIRRVMVAINTSRVDCGNIETTGTLRARQALLADDAALYSITKLRHQSWPVLREP